MINFKSFLIIVVLYMFTACFVSAQQKGQFKLKTVVIDPGHGGKDSGAVYDKYKEKDIVLDIALKLGSKLQNKYPDLNIVYTRKTDLTVTLMQRSEIANKADGDLFISIHVNSVTGIPAARGVETFTLGTHKNAANLAVARKENNVITLEDGYKQTYEGFDPNDEESYIMFSLGQHAYQRESLAFSFEVQKEFKSNLVTNDRGMKQAGFWVLWSISMPSILTEVGFISNTSDRNYLISSSGKEKIAKSLFDAFVSYKKDTEVESTYDVAIVKPKPELKSKELSMEDMYDNSLKVYFSVQMFASKSKFNLMNSRFNIVKGAVFMKKEASLFKYYAGKTNSKEEILSLQKILRKNGYKDAFVVAFKNDKKISVSDAEKLIN